jgi:hypothetical protein
MLRGSFALFALFIAIVPALAQSAQSTPADSPQPAPQQTHNVNKEDWTRMSVDRSVMPLLVAGASLGKSELPTYSRELLRLQWRPGDPIDIWLVKPHGVSKPRVAIYVYSYPTDLERFGNDSWCQAATQDGVAAVGFVSALTGYRFHSRPMREWFISELQESMATSAHDVQLIIDYLARRGDLSVDQVGIFGQGSGGSIAILAASADSRIRAIDLLNPWGDWPDWLKESVEIPDEKRASYLTPEFLQKASYVDPIDFLPSLKDRALRVQQILDYPNTPPAAREKIAAAVPAGDLVQYKDRTAHEEAWKTSGLSGWLAEQLGSKAAGSAGTASK